MSVILSSETSMQKESVQFLVVFYVQMKVMMTFEGLKVVLNLIIK